jgi:hypothetical protein
LGWKLGVQDNKIAARSQAAKKAVGKVGELIGGHLQL